MKQIPLGRSGLFALVDDEDYDDLIKFKWHYAGRYVWRMRPRKDGERWDRRIGLHRHIMGLDESDERVVDHIDRNPLNNQRSNLRICTEAQNLINKGMQSNNKSGYKGVTWAKHINKWRAQVRYKGKVYSAGVHQTPEAAYDAYCLKAFELHGEFANTETKEVAQRLKGREVFTPHKNKTGYRGVQYSTEVRKYRAKIFRDGKLKYLGFFETAELAYEAYLRAVREYEAGRKGRAQDEEFVKAA